MSDAPNDPRLDDRLRAAFAPPPDAAFRAVATRAVAAARPRPWWPWLVAAAAALLAVVLLLDRPRRGPQGHDGAELGRVWVTAYADAQRQGFTQSCCDPTFDLPSRCRQRFATALEVAASSGVDVIGCYCSGPDGGSLILLTRRDGNPGCVCVLPSDSDPGVVLPEGSGLQLARREVGPLVLYALGPTADEVALRQFAVP